MEWEGREESSNVEDRRGMRGTGLAIGGGAGILILILGLVFGVNPDRLSDMFGGGQQQTPGGQPDPSEARDAKFTKVIFRDTEIVWEEQFRKLNKTYKHPTLVLYTDKVRSGCGNADSSVGPFYCRADNKVYIDLSFYKDMEKKLGAPGEFPRAYVIAHEVGHHVQGLLGYSGEAEELVQSRRETQNQASVRLELQADYLAGVWAYHAKHDLKLTEKDIEQAIHAAHQIGDDYLRKRAGAQVFPEKFTHGSSAQRMRWFMEGYKTGSAQGARRLFDTPYNQL